MSDRSSLHQDTKATVQESPEVESFFWYHGYLPREEINRLIRTKGDYILRQTEKNTGEGFHLVLSVRGDDKPFHFIIYKTSNNQFYVTSRQTFPSIAALVRHYMDTGEEINDRTHATCKNPINRQNWEILRGQIELKDILGEGEYGTVHSGTLTYERTRIPVAVKVHKVKNLSKETVTEMAKEARLLREYDHPNLVRFYGVSFEREPIMLCMELADGGSLDKYLKKNKMCTKSKLKMCLEAAQGLAYLHSKNCIHRDVAARNCLVANGHIKLSDFGLAYQLRESHAVTESTNKNMPVRWLSPETLRNNTYSLKSDVYTFGVLMWEIFTNADLPFKEKTMKEVFDGVKEKGLRLERPKSMPESVAKIMTKGCFERDPEKRWTMEKVRDKLEQALKDMRAESSTKARNNDDHSHKKTSSKRDGSSKHTKSHRHGHKDSKKEAPSKPKSSRH